MKRRDFLKLLGIAPFAPSALATIPALPKPPEKFVGSSMDYVFYNEKPDCVDWLEISNTVRYIDAHNYIHVQFICSQPNTHCTFASIY